MTKVAFFHAHGTAWMLNWLETGFVVDLGGQVRLGGSTGNQSGTHAVISGLRGETYVWDLAPHNDPFPSMLDPNKWTVKRIKYPAAAFPMGDSISHGIAQTIAGINALPPGQPFCLGGYSQGAAVMSGVYNEIRYGSLTSRASSFLGAVMFGNPRRQVNHRGAVGGTWSGAWDVPGSSTGGHGSFPTSGSYARLATCESKWVEFTAADDIFSSTGDSTLGTNWTAGNNAITGLNAQDLVLYVASGMVPSMLSAAQDAIEVGGANNVFVDASGKTIDVPGGGHVTYPFVPPQGVGGTDTSYQIALSYLEGLADAWATAPIAAPNTTAGWSTTLLPPSV